MRRRSGDEDPVPVSESVAAVSARLGVGDARTVATVFGHWDDIVGPALCAHVHPLRLVDETLVVAVDHPAWATQVRQLAPRIIERLAEVCASGEAPQRLEVRVTRRTVARGETREEDPRSP
ncbi:MAG TPA: DUF721 domain-containing protein [Acidimicrobiales bacterium]|nr:DUF721 domain-containing protein [Acidimicrobiales bacterium]